MTKIKRKLIEASEVNQISIVTVAEDWGLQLFEQGPGKYLAYCINPDHSDKHLGSFHIIETGGKNFFHCFSCGINGGPIDLVMLIDGCVFIEALNKLGQKYNMTKYEYVDPSDLPPKWEGLTYDEYEVFGLKNVSIQIPDKIDTDGKLLYKHQRITLRELARDNPEFHDDLLLRKFLETVGNLSNLMYLMDTGRLRKSGLYYDSSWEDVFITIANEYKSLLEKGLVDKNKYDWVILSQREKIEQKICDLAKRVASEHSKEIA